MDKPAPAADCRAAGSFRGTLDDLSPTFTIEAHQIAAAVQPSEPTARLARKKRRRSDREIHDLLKDPR